MLVDHWNMLKERKCVSAIDVLRSNLPNHVTDLKFKAI